MNSPSHNASGIHCPQQLSLGYYHYYYYYYFVYTIRSVSANVGSWSDYDSGFHDVDTLLRPQLAPVHLFRSHSRPTFHQFISLSTASSSRLTKRKIVPYSADLAIASEATRPRCASPSLRSVPPLSLAASAHIRSHYRWPVTQAWTSYPVPPPHKRCTVRHAVAECCRTDARTAAVSGVSSIT